MKELKLTTFQSLNLDPLLLKSLEAEGYTTPTPIQAQAIPFVMEGRDLLGIAQTGTGKTAAFALPILHKLAAARRPTPRKGTRALILSPTRELANQIGDSFRTYGRHLGLSVTVVYGGVGYRPQTNALQRGVDILVATPGRLIDHMESGNLALDTTEIFVLDEADQMMDLGFIRPLRQITAKLPSRRQSLFFSATMPHEIGALASELLNNPAKVSVSPAAKTADRVDQKVIFIEGGKKRSLLVELFADAAMSRALVFTRTKRGADKVAKHLEQSGISVAAIHGNKSQGAREAALSAFKRSNIRALIATDIAARGIDIDQVSHVINYELPNVPESYVHRIGRTARAGLEGIAISFCDGEERAYLKDIERLIRQTIPSTDRRGDATLVAPPAEPKSQAHSDHSPRQRDGKERPHRQNRRPDRDEGSHGGGFRKPHRKGNNPYAGDRSERPDAPRGEVHGAASADAPRQHEGKPHAFRPERADGARFRDRPERAEGARFRDRPERSGGPRGELRGEPRGDGPRHQEPKPNSFRGDRAPGSRFRDRPERSDAPRGESRGDGPRNHDGKPNAFRGERSSGPRHQDRSDRGHAPRGEARSDDQKRPFESRSQGPRGEHSAPHGHRRPGQLPRHADHKRPQGQDNPYRRDATGHKPASSGSGHPAEQRINQGKPGAFSQRRDGKGGKPWPQRDGRRNDGPGAERRDRPREGGNFRPGRKDEGRFRRSPQSD